MDDQDKDQDPIPTAILSTTPSSPPSNLQQSSSSIINNSAGSSSGNGSGNGSGSSGNNGIRERKVNKSVNIGGTSILGNSSPNLNQDSQLPKVDFNKSRYDDEGYLNGIISGGSNHGGSNGINNNSTTNIGGIINSGMGMSSSNLKQSFYNESFRDQNEVYEDLDDHEKDAVLGVSLHSEGSDSDSDSGDSQIDENSFENNDIVNFEEDEKKRLYLKAYKETYQKVDFFLEHLNIFLSIVSIGLFITLSYIPNIVPFPDSPEQIKNNSNVRSINNVVIAISVYFCFDFVRIFIFAKDKIKFFKKKNTILDIITIVPILITIVPSVPVTPLGFLRVLRILKAPRLFKLHGATSVIQQIIQLILSILILIVLFASMICEIEGILFHTSIYYAVVSLSTVGYGDITPQSTLGRMVAILMIMVALGYLPVQTSKLISVLSATKAWNGEYKPSKKKKFVTVVGNIFESSLSTFLKEFFFNSRIGEMPVIILSNTEQPTFWDSLKNRIKKRYFFFKGSVGSQTDIDRVKLDRSKAVFIFSKKSLEFAQQDDNENILRVMSLRSFNNSIPIFAQAMKPRLKRKMIAAGATQVISVQELKMNLLAQSCISPGFITLVMNLLRSDLEKYEDTDEYASGNSYEIFTQPFSSAFYGLTFSQVVQLVYETFGMIIFGVEIQTDDKRRIKINPKNSFIIQEGTHGVLLAKNKLSSKRIKFCGTELVKRKIESLKQTNQRNTEIGILDKDCKLVWEYDPVEKSYQCKLKFVPKSSTKQNGKKSLRRLILEKKRDIANQKASATHSNSNTVNDGNGGASASSTSDDLLNSISNTTASASTFQNSNTVQNRNSISPTNLDEGSDGNDNFSILTNNLHKQHSHPHHHSSLSIMDSLDIHTHQTMHIRPPSVDLSNSYNNTATSIMSDIPTPPPSSMDGFGSSAGVGTGPKRFWASHFLEDCIVDSIESMDNIRNHIIIAGSSVDCIENFIAPLREGHIRRYEPIVILTPTLTEDQWKYIESFPEIYVVQGKPYEFSDLKRAGVYKCSKIVVLTHDNVTGDELIFNDRETLLAMVCLKEVAKKNEKIFPIYEISEPLNMKFLPGNSNWKQNEPFYHSPSFAAGNVFLSSVFDSLLCQCFFNPHLLSMLSVLVGMNEIKKSVTKIFQVPLPEHFYHHRFGYLFESLVESNIICIALFRNHCHYGAGAGGKNGAGTSPQQPINRVVSGLPSYFSHFGQHPQQPQSTTDGQTTRYVLTNPSPSTMLREDDRLFVLIRFQTNSVYCEHDNSNDTGDNINNNIN